MLTDPASFPYLYQPSSVRCVRTTRSGQYRHRYLSLMLTDPASFPYLYQPSSVRCVRTTCSGHHTPSEGRKRCSRDSTILTELILQSGLEKSGVDTLVGNNSLLYSSRLFRGIFLSYKFLIIFVKDAGVRQRVSANLGGGGSVKSHMLRSTYL
jgi:hypothetical protein